MAVRRPQRPAWPLAAVAQDSARSVGAVEAYLQSQIAALNATGVPACITLLVSDPSRQTVGGGPGVGRIWACLPGPLAAARQRARMKYAVSPGSQ